MLRSAKNYTKKTRTKTKKEKMDGQNPMTNGKSKAIQTKSHTESYTYTLTKREKGKKNVSLLPNSIWDDLLSIQVFHRCTEHQVDCGNLIRCS